MRLHLQLHCMWMRGNLLKPHRYLLPRLWLIQRPEITLMICVRITVEERHNEALRFSPYRCEIRNRAVTSRPLSPLHLISLLTRVLSLVARSRSSRIPFHSSTNHTYPVGAQASYIRPWGPSVRIGHGLLSEKALMIIEYNRFHVLVRSLLDTNRRVTLINHTAITRSWLCWLPLLGCIYWFIFVIPWPWHDSWSNKTLSLTLSVVWQVTAQHKSGGDGPDRLFVN
jgi:hypothetical protein